MPYRLSALFAALLFLLSVGSFAQIYSPVLLKSGQVNAEDPKTLVEGIYAQANAKTPREKAEAIWRFFLTDGRFVKPGFWYHIAGWAYEEPMGEVLDPVKLMNGYGFGLCYQIAPLLEAVFDAGGFEDARIWFLTGHTVAEVFYDGSYHYFDSDMMGYNTVGTGPLKQRRVASVHDIEKDGNIVLGKLLAPGRVDPNAVDTPWYPADVRAHAIGELAELFTTTENNWLYPFKRYPQGHRMDFVLRPGERMIRYFHPQSPHLYYLPFDFNGINWREFPQPAPEFGIRTENGPGSQKDTRTWATGEIEYRPQLAEAVAVTHSGDRTAFVFDMPCPYVIINAQYALRVNLPAAQHVLSIESSTDGGHTWITDATLHGPFQGEWKASAATVAKSEHGNWTHVSGTYGYKVRVSVTGIDPRAAVQNLLLTTAFQLNPRTLPEITSGRNILCYRARQQERTELPIRADRLEQFASKVENAVYVGDDGQRYLINQTGHSGEVLLTLSSTDKRDLVGFDAGGRFLDLRAGLAPDKLTAEVRKVAPWPSPNAPMPAAELAWSTQPDGPFQTLWRYDGKLTWKDHQPINRTLNWPEVDRHVDRLPQGTKKVFVRYRFTGMAMDDIRLAILRPARPSSSKLKITQLWRENGVAQSKSQLLNGSAKEESFSIHVPENTTVINDTIIFECLR